MSVWAKVAFIIYASIMMWLLFGQGLGYARMEYSEYFARNIILTPFRTVRRFINVLQNVGSRYRVIHAFVNLAGNMVMFIPLGMLLRSERMSFLRCMAECACIITAVEVIQIITMLGACDIDDLILNMAGAAAGYGL